jgi:peptide/nickel transport system ATP-binding protein
VNIAAHPKPDLALKSILQIEDLCVEFRTTRGLVRAVQNVSYEVYPGEMVAIVGESGSGKSVSALAIMGLLPPKTTRIPKGRVMFDGEDLLTRSKIQMQRIRGRQIGMIFQEPMTSLNPVLTIGDQLCEPLRIHLGMDKEAQHARAVELLGLVGISDAARRLTQYPHEFSGGMRQRVMIAIGLACNPKLLIADEPTTALDVTIQAQILELMKKLSRELGIAMIVITHNLGVVARYADRVNVMYAAQIAEKAEALPLFSAPLHPYTAGLLRAVPRLDQGREARLATIDGLPPDLMNPPAGCRFADRCPARIDACAKMPELREISPGHLSACHRAEEMNGPLRDGLYPLYKAQAAEAEGRVEGKNALEVDGLTMNFHVKIGRNPLSRKKAVVKAVDDVSFSIEAGRTLGLVGESGCGKTTVGRSILRLLKPTAGAVTFEGQNIARLPESDLTNMRKNMQVIFQDPFASLNPRMTVGQIIAEPMMVRKLVPDTMAARRRVGELLGDVGLPLYMSERYPHQLSGGQRQRVGIARALAMEPSTIICDEPVSALDVSVQAQIINLLEELQERLGITYLFIAHDLAVVRHISHRVGVMYLGRMMEIAESEALFADPLHPYTQALMDAAPIPDVELERRRAPRALKGEIPSPLDPPPGCVFSTRCPLATEECRQTVPQLREVRPGHRVACLKIEEYAP